MSKNKTETKNYHIAVLLVAFLLTTGIAVILCAGTPTFRLEDSVGNAVFIEVYDVNDLRLWCGSGAIIREKLIVTAKHLVEPQPDYYTGLMYIPHRLRIRRGKDKFETTIWAQHETADIALVYVDELTKINPPIFGTLRSVKLGDPIYVVGHPWCSEKPWITKGVLSNYENTDTKLWENVGGSDVDITSGSSGSGVYAEDGTLIGVAVGTYGELAYLTDLAYLWEIGVNGKTKNTSP